MAGSSGYLVYTYASYALAIEFNALFLVYVALLGLSLYTLIRASLPRTSQG